MSDPMMPPDLAVVCSIAGSEAGLRQHGTMELTHILLAVVLDPRARRGLIAAGCVVDALRTAADRVVRSAHSAPAAVEYSQEAGLALHRARERGGATLEILREVVAQVSLKPLFVAAGTNLALLASDEMRIRLDEVEGPSIELVNDDVTPFDFVIHSLAEVVGMDPSQATAFSQAVHHRGRERWPVPSMAAAEHIARTIESNARARKFPLVVRAITRA